MAKVGAQRAAVLTGKSKSTIQRSMNSGKLSYELDQNKRRIIDVSELERVFGIAQTAPESSDQPIKAKKESPASHSDIDALLEKERMIMQIKMLGQQLSTAQDQIDDLRSQRDKWEKQASQMLITSQYSQRQADSLRTQIKEREERARQKRLQHKTAKTQTAVQQQQKTSSASSSVKKRPAPSGMSQAQCAAHKRKDLEMQMRKLKAQNENAFQSSASVFRFWKKAK